MEATTGYTYICGIFYFPWHRHQIEGTQWFLLFTGMIMQNFRCLISLNASIVLVFRVFLILLSKSVVVTYLHHIVIMVRKPRTVLEHTEDRHMSHGLEKSRTI